MDLQSAPVPQGEGKQGSEGGLCSCLRIPIAETPPPRRLLTTREVWGGDWDTRLGHPAWITVTWSGDLQTTDLLSCYFQERGPSPADTCRQQLRLH